MSMNLADLPPQAREKIASKLVKEERDNLAGSKYYNQKAVRVLEDGTAIHFDSQKEARRFDELSILLKAGKIRNLKLQAEFTLREAYTSAEGYHVRSIRYRADFEYEEQIAPDTWKRVVEDVKSDATKTRVYSIKKKLLYEKFGILIRET